MCTFCNHDEITEKLHDMINHPSHRYAWAFDTLSGIKETIAQTGHVTPGQIRAIENIENARKR